MISTVKAYTASDGTVWPTLEAAQWQELLVLFDDGKRETPWGKAEIVQMIIDNADRVIDVLTTTQTSRPKRRLVNGYKPKAVRKAVTKPAAKGAKHEAEADEPKGGESPAYWAGMPGSPSNPLAAV